MPSNTHEHLLLFNILVLPAFHAPNFVVLICFKKNEYSLIFVYVFNSLPQCYFLFPSWIQLFSP